MTRPRHRPVVNRSVPWGMLDQAVSAGSNVLLTVAVARTSSPAALGMFSLAYVVYIITLGTARTTGTGVLTIEYGDDASRLRGAAPHATGYAVGLGAAVGAGCVVLGLALRGELGRCLVVLGVALPLLLLQDAWRGLFMCQRRPLRALVNDSVWALLFVVALVVLMGSGPAPWLLLACWAAAGGVAALFGIVQISVLPRPALPHRWLGVHRSLAHPLAVSELLTQLPAHVTYLFLPLVASVADLGIVRASYVFFGPLAVLNAGASLLALPSAVRARQGGGVNQVARRVSAWLAAAALVWGSVVVLLPEEVGEKVVGRSWQHSGAPRLLLAVSLVAEAVLVGQVAALGALRLAGRLMRVRLVSAPVTVVVALALAGAFGASGAAGGFAIGYWVAAVLAWVQVERQRAVVADSPEVPVLPLQSAPVGEPL